MKSCWCILPSVAYAIIQQITAKPNVVELLVQVFLLKVLAPSFRSQTHLGLFVCMVQDGSPTLFCGVGISSFLSTICSKDSPSPTVWAPLLKAIGPYM